jgi:hypothetical protein
MTDSAGRLGVFQRRTLINGERRNSLFYKAPPRDRAVTPVAEWTSQLAASFLDPHKTLKNQKKTRPRDAA